jgi:PAS domain S-box-containing protein
MAHPLPPLSAREQAVLSRAASGVKDAAIADALGISLGTIATYWNRIRAKYGPHNRAELVAIYVRDQGARAVQELQDRYRDLQAIIDSAADTILVITPEGEIEEANDAAVRMFGYSRDELPGLPVRFLVPEAHRPGHGQLMADYWAAPVRKRMGAHIATSAIQKDGTEIPIAAVLNVFESSRGQRVSCVIRDLRYRDHHDGSI